MCGSKQLVPPVQMPPSMSSQEDSTVDGRDLRIARLEKLLQEQYEAHSTTLAELAAVKVQSAQDSFELQELRKENEILHNRLAQLANDMDKKSLHEYATLIVEAAPSTISSAYIVQLQSKLCKAIHQRGAWGNQLTMLKESCQKVVKSLQDDVVDAVNDKCQAEMGAMNKVLQAEKEKNIIRAECEDKINGIRAECEDKINSIRLEYKEELNSQQEETERLRIHLDMEKEARESLVSVCTQQQAEESASLGEKKMSREKILRQEDIERINKAVDQLRKVSEGKSMHFGGNAVEAKDQIPKSVVPSNRIGQRLSQLRSSVSLRNVFVEQPTMDLGRNFKEIGPPRGTGNSTPPSPGDKSQLLFSSRASLTSIPGIEEKKEFRAVTA